MEIKIGTLVDFPGRPSYIAGTVVAMDDDYFYVTDGHSNRKYPRDPYDLELRPHRHGGFCDCDCD